MSIDKNLLSGTYRTLFLMVISKEDMCGVDIAGELEKKTNGILKIRPGSLYPVLQKLERQGYLTSRIADSPKSKGRSLKVYSITPEGRALLHEKKGEWVLFVNTVGTVLELNTDTPLIGEDETTK